MDVFEGAKEFFRPKDKGTAVTVQFMEKKPFEKMVDGSPKETVDIDMETWQETDGNTPISNHGAGPCVIIYAVDRLSGRVLSGHFPELLKDRQEMFDKQALERKEYDYPKTNSEQAVIEMPKPEDVDRLSYVRTDKSYEQYVLMKKRLHEMVKESGQDNVEVFLFGNNWGAYGRSPTEYAQKIVDSALEQNEVAFDLYQAGIPYGNQHDFRVAGQDNVDDTFYDPKTRVINHSIRDHREGRMYWLKN